MNVSQSTILIIDSSYPKIDLLEGVLRGQSYRLDVVQAGSDVLEAALTLEPDLILLNLPMTEMDGYELCRKLKSESSLKDIPLILLVEEPDKFDRELAFRLGASDYIAYPFGEAELCTRVKTQLELKSYRTRLLEENRQLTKSFENTFQQVSVGIAYADLSGRLLRANRSFCEMLGYSEDELINGSIVEAIHPDDRDSDDFALKRVLKGERESYVNEVRIFTKSGDYRWFQVSGTLVRKADGTPDYYIGVGIDIGRRKEAEELLKRSELRLKEAQRLSGMGNWELDLKSDGLYWSDEIYNIFEMEPGGRELGYSDLLAMVHPEERDIVEMAYREHLESKDEFDINHRVLLKDGTVKYINEKCRTEYDSEGNPLKSVGTLHDITREKRAEEKYRVLTERFTMATGAAGIGVWELDVKSGCIIWDDMMYSLYGLKRDDYPDPYKGWVQVVHPDDRESADKEGQRALLGEINYDTTFRIIRPDSSVRYIRSMATLYKNSDDEPISMIGVNWDITESKMLDLVNQTLLKLSREASTLSCDELVQKTVDMAVEIASSSLGFFHFINPDQASLSLQAWSTGTKSLCSVSEIEKGSHYALEEAGIWVDCIRERRAIIVNDYPGSPAKKGVPEGHVGLKRFMTIPIMSGDRFAAIIGVGNKEADYSDFDLNLLGLLAKNSWNIIKRKQSEEQILRLNEELEDRVKRRTIRMEEAIQELRESEEGLRIFSQALQYNPASIVITDPGGIIEYVNPKFCRVSGYSEVEVVGKTPSILRSGKHSAEFYEELWREIRGGHEWRGEIINRKKKGECFWEAVSISPIFDSDGKIIHYVGIKEDITERKQMEQELKLAKEVAEAATRAKSDFLANMSHEIRTPMNAIVSLNYLLSQTELTAKQEGYVSKMKNSARGLLGIINDILDFSKIEAGKLEVENIEFELKDVISNLGNMIGHKVQERGLKLTFEISTRIPVKLVGDPLRLGQVLLNLTGNALKFTKKGEIRIGCRLVRQEEDRVTLKFMVSDTGIGMSEEQQGKLFLPFSQADTSITRKYGGTGLGLSISWGIVKTLGGRMWVTSRPGEGSTFYFTIDCRVKEMVRGDKRVVPKELENLRVMVVDDEENNLIILKSYLEKFSISSSVFKRGEDAIEELTRANRSEKEAYRLVLLDWKMPGMSGSEVIKRIKRLEGTIKPKIIIVTGYSREQIIMETQQAGADGFLFKPICRSMLFDLIMQTLVKPEKIKCALPKKRKPGRVEDREFKVLLVEDNEINQQVAVEILEQRGIVVDVAENGEDALTMLESNSYNLVLMDLQMPIMDGFKTTEEIRKQERYDELPIIAITADAMAGVESAALAIGMNDYVTKPIDPERLFETVCRWGGITEESDGRPVDGWGREPSLPVIEHVAVQEGVKRLGGNVERYLKLVSKFKENNTGTVEQIRRLLNKRDYDEARKLVHAVKGVSGNIGAKELFKAAAELDNCLKEVNEPSKIEGPFDHFISVINALFAAIERFEGEQKKAGRVEAEEGQEPSREELELLRPKLEEFKAYLASNNTRSIKLFTSLTNEIGPGDFKSRLLNLEEFLDNYNFTEAHSLLNELIKSYYK